MPSTLMEFFEQEFLPVQDLSEFKVKQFRNAIGRFSLVLGHPAEFVDAIEPGMRSFFIEELLKLGFTINRAEEFCVCIKKVKNAMREAKRVTPRPAANFIQQACEWIGDHPGSIAAAFTEFIGKDDQLLSGAVQELEAVQAHIDSIDESELA